MTATQATGLFSAFRYQSFRYQWSSDLLTSWAGEMETLVLGWFVLQATDSPLLLAVLGALHFSGSLLSPFLGVIADRIDRRSILIFMRSTNAVLATSIAILGVTDSLQTWHLFAIACVSGLIRPSDLGLRNVLVADIVPQKELGNALGFSRTTMDSARIAGALLGAGMLSTLGIGAAYGAIVGLYASAVIVAFGITLRRTTPPSMTRPVEDLKSGISYIRQNETLVATMLLAFLANLTAYPISHGLLPVVARDIYLMDATGLARLVVAFSIGALFGSISIAISKRKKSLGRTTVIWLLTWHTLILIFGQIESAGVGLLLLCAIGAAHSFGIITMSILQLTLTDSGFQGRVQGIRMLAIYGLPLGLVLAGALIERFGIQATFTLYGLVGIGFSLAIVLRWPAVLKQ